MAEFDYCIKMLSVCRMSSEKLVYCDKTTAEDRLIVFCLVNVYSRTCVLIFIEIGLYSTDTEPNISWQVFMKHRVRICRPTSVIDFRF